MPAANDVCNAGLGLFFFWTPPDRLVRKLGDWDAELESRVSGRGRRFVGGESSKYRSNFGKASIEWMGMSGTEDVFVSIDGVGSGSTWVPSSRLDSVGPVDAGSVCSTSLSEAGGSEVLSKAVVATVASLGGSVGGSKVHVEDQQGGLKEGHPSPPG